jgi:sodium-dependent dicarboxylate transporter 2/3/5
MDLKKSIGLTLAVLVLVLTALTPPLFGLTLAAKNTLGILLVGLILWILEIMPLCLTAFLVIILQPLFGVSSLADAFVNFANPVVFFVIASFAISLAIMKTPLALRLVRGLLRRSGNSAGKILLAFMAAGALLSAIMSNVPVTSLFMGLGLSLLAKMENDSSKNKLGKALMIAIPFAGMIGGIMTPAGSSINILTLNLLEAQSGIRVSFFEWMLYGIPITVVVVPICWFILVKMFKPEDIRPEIVAEFMADDTVPAKMGRQEIKVIVIISAVILLWIAGSWVPALDITLVALAGMIAFFLPGINVLEWEEFSQNVSWNAVIMIGGVISIGKAAINVGLGDWLMDLFLAGLARLDLFTLLIVLGIAFALIKLPIPIGPAVVTMSVAPLYALAVMMGLPPEMLIIPLAFHCGACLLVPLDAVPLITYSQGYYTMRDMFISGSLTTLFWIIVTAAWVPVVGKLLNLI